MAIKTNLDIMKKSIIVFVLLYTVFTSAQKGIVYYGFINSMGIGDMEGKDLNAYMTFNNQQSYYVTAKDSLEKSSSESEQKITYKKNGEGIIHIGSGLSDIGDQVVNNLLKKTMWSNFLSGNQVYIKETTPNINWKISKEIKKIGKFTCKKASANFRGRNYTAWFSSEIPLSFGPWKLNGLPGLILEAYDADKSVYWYFKSVEYPSKTNADVKYMKIPKSQHFKSYDEFKKFQQEKTEDLADKQKIAKKSFPDVILTMPKKSDIYIECE